MNINTLYGDARGGHRTAEEKLFVSMSAMFRLFVRQRIRNRMDAEEVVQDALATIFREYRDMTFTTSFSAWAYKVLDNRILGYIQKRKREGERVAKETEQNQVQANPDARSDSDLKRRLLDCLRKIGNLNIRYARILNFHYQGYKTNEICGRLELKPMTFHSILSRARSMLESCLETGEVKR